MNQEESGTVAQFENVLARPMGSPVLPSESASPPGTCLQEAWLQGDLPAAGDLTSAFLWWTLTVVSIYMMLTKF